FEQTSGTGPPAVRRIFSRRTGLPDGRARALLEHSDGSIWVGTENGLAVLPSGGSGFVSYDSRNGLTDVQLRALAEDPAGNFGPASESALMRLTRSCLVTYDTADGLGGNSFVSAFEGRDGRAYFVNGIRKVFVNRFDGSRFQAVQPLTQSDKKLITYMGWGI